MKFCGELCHLWWTLAHLQKIQFGRGVRSYFSPFLFPSSFNSSIMTFLNLMISVLRLSTEINSFSFLSFSKTAIRFSSLARCWVPFSPVSFFDLISLCTHGIRKSSLSQALTDILSSNFSFSTNKMLILFSVFSTWRSYPSFCISAIFRIAFFSA